VGNGRAGYLPIKKEGGSGNILAHEETDSSKHGNTSMSHFSLAVTVEGVCGSLFGKLKGVEESIWFSDPREALGVPGVVLEGCGFLVDSRITGSIGSGRAEESKEGDSEFHGLICLVRCMSVF
jgi:hypothetical protein